MSVHPKVREILNQIDEVLAAGASVVESAKQPRYMLTRDRRLTEDEREIYSAATQLWDVLTALRGPDNNSYKAKAAITELIRTAAFPKTRAAGGTSWIANFADSDSEAALELRMRIRNYPRSEASEFHFVQHGSKAFTALGLRWHAVNPVVKESDDGK